MSKRSTKVPVNHMVTEQPTNGTVYLLVPSLIVMRLNPLWIVPPGSWLLRGERGEGERGERGEEEQGEGERGGKRGGGRARRGRERRERGEGRARRG